MTLATSNNDRNGEAAIDFDLKLRAAGRSG